MTPTKTLTNRIYKHGSDTMPLHRGKSTVYVILGVGSGLILLTLVVVFLVKRRRARKEKDKEATTGTTVTMGPSQQLSGIRDFMTNKVKMKRQKRWKVDVQPKAMTFITLIQLLEIVLTPFIPYAEVKSTYGTQEEMQEGAVFVIKNNYTILRRQKCSHSC
ncbi:hypothetical protein Tcan_04755 [Toxocara canis]|uniref:Uncharacterized protein n=1 Tax=Toxocara canis TaxID=6265 RepID=A0A0B2V9V3_TOXCA|nr:hypothetical protein Tcan_04755 [Toxocara canis]